MAQSEAPALLDELEQLSATQLKCERRWTARGRKEKDNRWMLGKIFPAGEVSHSQVALFFLRIFAVKAAGS